MPRTPGDRDYSNEIELYGVPYKSLLHGEADGGGRRWRSTAVCGGQMVTDSVLFNNSYFSYFTAATWGTCFIYNAFTLSLFLVFIIIKIIYSLLLKFCEISLK